MKKLLHEDIPRPDAQAVPQLPRHPITAVLDNIRSIHNVGAIFRTSDAALVEHLILSGITATPGHPQIHKTALGAQDTVPWSYVPAAEPSIQSLRKDGYRIAALEITDTPTLTTSLEPDAFPLCIVVGNELTGVRQEILDLADFALEIPQFGAKQSLNVAVAYGIAVFDLVRRLRGIL